MGEEKKYPKVKETPATVGPDWPDAPIDSRASTAYAADRLAELEEQGVPPAQWGGVFCTPKWQPLARYIKRGDETIYDNPQGSYICLGSDNLGGRDTGYGGAGDARASKIDLVCGRNGSHSWPDQNVDPLPFGDSARIYMSEKTDCDKNFGLVDGTVGRPIAKSAVILKADGIRIIGREGVKIVSGIGLKGESNSLGGNITKKGIDLIACNDDSDLQPLVKGKNLIDALTDLSADVQAILAQVNNFILYQLEYNGNVAAHPHISPFFVAPTTPSPTLITPTQQVAKRMAGEMMPDLLQAKVNMETNFKDKYLDKDNTDTYLLSHFNNTN